MDKIYKIEISAKTIIFTVLFLIFINLLWLVRELIFSFFIAFIVMSALNPWVSFLNKYLPNITNNAFKIISNVFSNIIFMISTIFFSFYFLVEEGALRNFITRFFSKGQATKTLSSLNRTEKRLRSWFWG